MPSPSDRPFGAGAAAAEQGQGMLGDGVAAAAASSEGGQAKKRKRDRAESAEEALLPHEPLARVMRRALKPTTMLERTAVRTVQVVCVCVSLSYPDSIASRVRFCTGSISLCHARCLSGARADVPVACMHENIALSPTPAERDTCSLNLSRSHHTDEYLRGSNVGGEQGPLSTHSHTKQTYMYTHSHACTHISHTTHTTRTHTLSLSVFLTHTQMSISEFVMVVASETAAHVYT